MRDYGETRTDPHRRKGNTVTPNHGEPIPEHVAQYLARVALAHIPASVYETLLSLTPEELDVLERVGLSFKESELESHSWAYAIH